MVAAPARACLRGWEAQELPEKNTLGTDRGVGRTGLFIVLVPKWAQQYPDSEPQGPGSIKLPWST